MKNFQHIVQAFVVVSLLVVSGCAPVVLGAGGVAGMVGMQERSAGAAVDDAVIWSEIKHHYVQKDINNLVTNVSIEVNEGRVLLTGAVKTPDIRVEAVRLAWQPEGVREVINEIQVTDKVDVKSYAKDAWITARVKSKMLLNESVQSINYSVETVNRAVYLMGIAQSQHELDTVMSLSSTVSGVDKVISHVRIKDSYLRQAPKGE